MATISIYGCRQTRSLRALWALEEAGAEYDYLPVDLHAGEARRAPFIELNPGGKVPVLVDGDLVLSESAAIALHVADTYPAAGLAPAPGSAQRARLHQWCFFALSELEQPLWTIAKHTFVFAPERRVPAILECAGWEFARACKVLERGLADNPFILGEQFSVADILLGHTLRWAAGFKLKPGSERLEAYLGRLGGRPALARALAREAAG